MIKAKIGSLLLCLSLPLLFVSCNSGSPASVPTLPTVGAVQAPTRSAAVVGKHEQDACHPVLSSGAYGQGNCEDGLVCLPDIYDAAQAKGVCRVECMKVVEKADGSGNTIEKAPENCPTGRSCQIVVGTNLGVLGHEPDVLGAFCLASQRERDGLCVALSDDNACTNGRRCAPSDMSLNDQQQVVAKSYVCRDTCHYDAADVTKGCKSGEICFEQNGGICATAVTWASITDFAGGGHFPRQKLCNEQADHRFCDGRPFAGLGDDAGHAECVEITHATGVGLCFAVCSSPSIDRNGDGKIDEHEKGQQNKCPANFTCSGDLGREIGIVVAVGDATTGERRSCDPTKCQAHQPCPAECGLGDAECLSFERDGHTVNFCGAPAGSCEPKPTVSVTPPAATNAATTATAATVPASAHQASFTADAFLDAMLQRGNFELPYELKGARSKDGQTLVDF